MLTGRHGNSAAPSWFTRPIVAGDTGPDVRVVLRKLGLNPEGEYDALAVARIKGVARQMGIFTHDGVVDAEMANLLGEAETAKAGLDPEWFALRPGDFGSAVADAARLLGVGGRDYGPELEAAVRRFQSANRIEPTGTINAETARLMGER